MRCWRQPHVALCFGYVGQSVSERIQACSGGFQCGFRFLGKAVSDVFDMGACVLPARLSLYREKQPFALCRAPIDRGSAGRYRGSARKAP